MLHRAALGSLERFIGVLIEHHAGNLPFWLAPVQAVVLNISEKQADYAASVLAKLKNKGFALKLIYPMKKLAINSSALNAKIPYLLVVGDSEVENQQVTVRKQDGSDLGAMSIADFLAICNT